MMDDDLDMSWVKEYSRIHTIQQIMNREELDAIVIQTIYMNADLEITKIDKEMLKLNTHTQPTKNKMYISKEQLLKIVQTKKFIDNTKYKLFDLLVFSVDLDPKDIQKYVNGECRETLQLKTLPVIDDIFISPSLFIFHSLHTVFLLLSEIVQKQELVASAVDSEKPIKSILKTALNENDKKHKHTKKVRILDNIHTIKPKKTRKVWNAHDNDDSAD